MSSFNLDDLLANFQPSSSQENQSNWNTTGKSNNKNQTNLLSFDSEQDHNRMNDNGSIRSGKSEEVRSGDTLAAIRESIFRRNV